MKFPFENIKSVSWQKLGLSILCGILAAVLLLMVFATAYVHDLVDKISYIDGDHIDGTLSSSEYWDILQGDTVSSDFTGETIHPSDITVPTRPDLTIENPDVINIMLVGQDRRPGEGRQRSDSMILCSFNTRTHAFSMTSFLRDTYVEIPGHGYRKMNTAYAFGGMKLLTETIRLNFGVVLDGCVEVDFNSFITIIDMLGGVDISLTQKEVNYLVNTYKYDVTVGMNHLSGSQALTYARIRVIDMDAKRAERQRKVITSLINAYKTKGVLEIVSLAREILDTGLIKTNMKGSDIINYVTEFFPFFAEGQISSHQIPVAGTYDDSKNISGVGLAKVIVDMETNRKLLLQLLG